MRAVIVGAGASVPYGMPLAGGLVKYANDQILAMSQRARGSAFSLSNYDIAKGDDVKLAILDGIVEPLRLANIEKAFREHFVQQNLDDFVRDHPSLTDVVSRLITAKLFESFYYQKDGQWELKNPFVLGHLPPDKDWMRLFVGVQRPLTKNATLTVISFNYDAILERAMRHFWPHAETKYPNIDEAVEFIYPHGNFKSLPPRVNSPRQFIAQEAGNLRLGDNIDEKARANARRAIQSAAKIYSIGFSFGDSNVDLLGLTQLEHRHQIFVQTYKNEDKRLLRTLTKLAILPIQHDEAEMDRLVLNGFFEQ